MHYFITNREIQQRGTKEVSRPDGREHAGDDLRFGSYDIENDEFELFPDPTKTNQITYSGLKATNTSSLKGSARFFKELYDDFRNKENQTSGKNDVLFFIHGFNTDLNSVRSNFKELHKRYVLNEESPIGRIVIFTWPGRSSDLPLHYHDDKKDAERSGETLARCMAKLLDFFQVFLARERNPLCKGKVHLLVHSMGNRVLKQMMIEMSIKQIPYPEIFDQIILMAADIEYSIFEKGEAFNRLIEWGKRIHIYFHEKDIVLDISKYTKNFNNRLGRYGRKRNDIVSPDIIDVNATGVKDDLKPGLRTNQLNHWYYYSSSLVIAHVIKVLNGEPAKGIV
ncbi:MAG: alpha/beta hydrolase [Saprospiraceae bacterium]|nr:alpha/beta hydrolase [Saprospiraceae bacterium]